MIRIEVKYFAALRKGLHNKSEIYLQDRSNISDLLDHLDVSRDAIFIIIVNDQRATFDYELKNDDKVTLIPLIGGG